MGSPKGAESFVTIFHIGYGDRKRISEASVFDVFTISPFYMGSIVVVDWIHNPSLTKPAQPPVVRHRIILVRIGRRDDDDGRVDGIRKTHRKHFVAN